MKRVIIFLFVVFCSLTGFSQKISDAYLLKYDHFNEIAYNRGSKNFKNSYSDETIAYLNYVSKNGGKNNYLLLKKIFSIYLKNSNQDLDTAKFLYVMEIKPGGHLIWNQTDTVYAINTKNIHNNINLLEKLKLVKLDNKQINYQSIIDVMHMISSVPFKRIGDAIYKKTHNQNGNGYLSLDGYNYNLYTFVKNKRGYDVQNFIFRNPMFN